MSAIKQIILIGGGGHCKSCIDVIEAENRFKIAGIIDVKEKLHQKILDYEVMACDEDIPDLVREYTYFFITLGHIKRVKKRVERFNFLKNLSVQLPVIVSPRAYISKQACIQEGTIIMHNIYIIVSRHS